MKKRSYYRYSRVLLFILALTFVLIKWLTIENPLGSDDINYMALAEHLSLNTFRFPEAQNSFRTGILVPLNIIIRLFGFHIYSYYIFSTGFCFMLVLSVFFVTRQLFGLKTAFWGGCILLFSPLINYQSTNVLPDIPAFTWMLFSLLFFIKSGKREKAMFRVIIASLFAYLAYSSKEPVIVFILAFPFIDYFGNHSFKRTLYFTSGLVIFWLAESFIFYLITGDFFAKSHAVKKGIDIWMINQNPVTIWTYLFGSLITISQSFGGKFLFIAGAFTGISLAVVKRNKFVLVLLLAAFAIFAVYTFPVYSWNPLIPALPLQLRYLTGFFTTLAIISAWAIVSVYQYAKRSFPKILLRFWISLLGIYVALTFFIEMNGNKNTVLNRDNPFFEVLKLYGKRLPAKNNDSVYAMPTELFRLYPGFARLNLRTSVPQGPHYILFTKEFVQYQWEFAQKAKDSVSSRMYQDYLHGLNISKIIDYKGIVLARSVVAKHPVDTIFNLKKYPASDFFGFNDHEFSILPSKEFLYEIKPLEAGGNPVYFYSWRGDFSKIPDYNRGVVPMLEPNHFYRLVFDVVLQKKLTELYLVVNEYDENKQTQRHEQRFDHPPAGSQKWEVSFRSVQKTGRFKIFVRIINMEPGNCIKIRNIFLLKGE